MAMSDTCQQVSWIQSLMSELGFPLSETPVCANNQGSIFIGSNPVQERHTKHIDIHYHYICKCIEDKKVSVVFLPGCNNPMDMFTKNLPQVAFHKFREQLGLIFPGACQLPHCD